MSPFVEDNSSIGSIATNVTVNDVGKIEGKDVFKYSLKWSEKIKTVPTKTSNNLSRKGEATFVSNFISKVSCFGKRL